ncbi:TetR family transcriptional regulator [Saccharothrix sp. ALI-22-I]|uniref:TetR/AcrR family transcriptional regulator n=1 Tax=Saccharothrix sp. ALI-22-I TaxID=1933778 RepID=UPI00097BE955|nr:TetR/AcrR family transcriptional regulator [Saccharothrix sp. ALI-22-I]ONI90451.1 TetR family transcriptional regulator [Saccharothrix sp. ALI-22-I]
MTSQRHSDDALLDAARDCVVQVGVRRTTLTDIAKRAGVSRMTLYRRFPDVGTLVRALMTREFTALLQRITVTGDNTRQRLVAQAIASIRLLAADPLMRRVLDLDAELMLPYLVQRLGSTQKLVEAFLVAQIEAGHADGSIRAGSPAAQARLVLLTTQSLVLSIRPATTDLDFEELLAELATYLDAALS